MLEIENNGWELSGIFHSHPHGPPVPSPSDVAQAYYPEAVYLICAPDARGAWRGRGFRIEAGQVAEVEIKLEG
jgi:proteasome lid subunit RPN8/RPN11